jgi:hypothetical protein
MPEHAAVEVAINLYNKVAAGFMGNVYKTDSTF